MELKYGDAIRVSSRDEHYEIREELSRHGFRVQSVDEGWDYEGFPIIGYSSFNDYDIVGFRNNADMNILTKDEFYERLGINVVTKPWTGTTLVFNFINSF